MAEDDEYGGSVAQRGEDELMGELDDVQTNLHEVRRFVDVLREVTRLHPELRMS